LKEGNVRRHLIFATLVLATVVGTISVSLITGATTVPKKTRPNDSAALRVSTFNRLSSGSHTIVLNVGGLQRTFIVEVPPRKPVANRALVLVFHGGDDTAANTVHETDLLQQVTARGDLIVFLQGYENTWNEGSGMTAASLANVNDVAFTAAVIARLRQLFSYDPKRVAAVGFSNGAIMVEDLGCQLAASISLIVPVEGQMSTVQSASCAPARAESVYEIHGTADSVIPYNGGYFLTTIGEDTVLSAPNSVARWASLDGCSAGPATSTPSSAISLSTYSKCRNGAFVTLRTITGGNHAWTPNIGELVVQELALLPK
jgi:polyhydroxybutyrate depolymerase